MAMRDATDGHGGGIEGELSLRLELRIDPEGTYECPLADVDDVGDVEDVRCDATDDGCTVDLVTANEGVVRAAGTVEDDCLCAIFQNHECVPVYAISRDGSIEATTYVDRRETVRSLILELRDAVDSVVLDRLMTIGEETNERTTVIDLSILTDKQREALELAVLRGYYDGRTDLSSMAEELDISDSALSERLRAANAKLVTDLFV